MVCWTLCSFFLHFEWTVRSFVFLQFRINRISSCLWNDWEMWAKQSWHSRIQSWRKLNHCFYFPRCLCSSLILGAVMSAAHQCKSFQSIGKFNHVRTWWQSSLYRPPPQKKTANGSFNTVSPEHPERNKMRFGFLSTHPANYISLELCLIHMHFTRQFTQYSYIPFGSVLL